LNRFAIPVEYTIDPSPRPLFPHPSYSEGFTVAHLWNGDDPPRNPPVVWPAMPVGGQDILEGEDFVVCTLLPRHPLLAGRSYVRAGRDRQSAAGLALAALDADLKATLLARGQALRPIALTYQELDTLVRREWMRVPRRSVTGIVRSLGTSARLLGISVNTFKRRFDDMDGAASRESELAALYITGIVRSGDRRLAHIPVTGGRYAAIRRRLGHSQQTLAEVLGVSRVTIARREKDARVRQEAALAIRSLEEDFLRDVDDL
jgi:DNA-binding XRE family transcriptional regulator